MIEAHTDTVLRRKGASCPGGAWADRGGIKVRVLLAAATLIVVGILVITLLSGSEEAAETHRRKALQISEYGLIQSLTRLQAEPSWREGFKKTSHLKGWYKVALLVDQSGDAPILTVSAVGHSGSSLRAQICTLVLSIEEGDSLWKQQSIRQE